MKLLRLEQLNKTDFAIHWDDGVVSRHHGADLRKACTWSDGHATGFYSFEMLRP